MKREGSPKGGLGFVGAPTFVIPPTGPSLLLGLFHCLCRDHLLSRVTLKSFE